MGNDSEQGGRENRPEDRTLELRVAELEARVESLSQAYSQLRHQTRRVRLRPPLWTFEQYTPRVLSIDPRYRDEQPPAAAPAIAIVTPSFNHCDYLRATI